VTTPFEPRAHCANTLHMSDPTEAARRDLIADEMREVFTVTAFLAPFVTVTRKADGQKGTLMFSGSPRFYFSWVPE